MCKLILYSVHSYCTVCTGVCVWANEFEMGVICDALDMVCLIIDFQARDTQSRFVSVGKKENGKEIYKGESKADNDQSKQ